jgi:hypothetical protein
MSDQNHHLEFYDSDSYLAEIVARFVAVGLEAGDATLLITTPDHQRNFSAALAGQGIDADAHVRRGKLVFLDARHLLSRFMVDAMPHPERFKTEIGTVVDTMRASQGGARVQAFGEMVDLLWRDGNAEAATRVEELWNDVATTHHFSLLSAYAMSTFAGGSRPV